MRPPAGVTPAEADGIVDARLGRPAQDLLEAAVVLEAWGGVPSEAALALDAGVLPARVARGGEAHGRADEERDASGRASVVAEGVALLVAIVAVAVWAGPLSRQLGATTLEHTLRIALPLTLGLQWTLRSRLLGRPGGLRLLAAAWAEVAVVSAAVAAALALVADAGALAGAFVLIWVGGTVLARRGWGLAYAALVAGEALALGAGVAAAPSLAALATLVLAGCALAVLTARDAATEQPGRLRRALAAGAIGALLGGLLVGDTSLGWGVRGAFPGLALVPSVVGSLWGGYHLWQFHAAVPRGLRGVSLAQAGGEIPGGPAMAILRGALVRLLGVTLALSLLVAAAARWTQGTDRAGLFVAFGAAALVCLLASLHESLGYPGWALAVAAASLAAELVVNRWVGSAMPGLALSVAGTLGALLALAPLVGWLRSPGRMLATALWIK